MAVDELIDEHVSLQQCQKAIDALHSFETKRQQELQETELISGKEPNIWLNVTVKKIPPGHRIKPVKVPVVHPLVDPRTSSICLITKDPQREYKDLLETHKIKFISRVVGVEKLKGKFKPYEARRALLKENGMFLADERVVPLLPKLLGKKWFDAKKQPIPVCLKRKDLKGELERAISSTYMNQNQGTCTSIKIATLSHKPSQVLANLQKALPTIVANIKDGWENIQSLHIKTNSSVSLPIWTCALDASEGGRWHNLEAEMEVEGEGSESEEEEPEVAKKAKGKNGKKRASTTDVEMEEAPKKRSKSTKEAVARTSKPSKSDSAPAGAAKPASTKKSTKVDAPQPSKDAPVPSKKVKTSKAVLPPAQAAKASEKAPSSAPPSKLELKAKREGKPLEKKKEKVVKHKSGQSVKDKLLGKKAAQS